MTQPTLFDEDDWEIEDYFPDAANRPGAHRHKDPDTSVDAANSVDATALETSVLAVFRGVPARYGLTSEEVAAFLRMELGSVTPRFRPLEAKGYIYRTAERRPGKSGRNRIVWKLVR